LNDTVHRTVLSLSLAGLHASRGDCKATHGPGRSGRRGLPAGSAPLEPHGRSARPPWVTAAAASCIIPPCLP
jgi:hypothetical protein